MGRLPVGNCDSTRGSTGKRRNFNENGEEYAVALVTNLVNNPLLVPIFNPGRNLPSLKARYTQRLA